MTDAERPATGSAADRAAALAARRPAPSGSRRRHAAKGSRYVAAGLGLVAFSGLTAAMATTGQDDTRTPATAPAPQALVGPEVFAAPAPGSNATSGLDRSDAGSRIVLRRAPGSVPRAPVANTGGSR